MQLPAVNNQTPTIRYRPLRTVNQTPLVSYFNARGIGRNVDTYA
jgi:hypothetical protein